MATDVAVPVETDRLLVRVPDVRRMHHSGGFLPVRTSNAKYGYYTMLDSSFVAATLFFGPIMANSYGAQIARGLPIALEDSIRAGVKIV